MYKILLSKNYKNYILIHEEYKLSAVFFSFPFPSQNCRTIDIYLSSKGLSWTWKIDFNGSVTGSRSLVLLLGDSLDSNLRYSLDCVLLALFIQLNLSLPFGALPSTLALIILFTKQVSSILWCISSLLFLSLKLLSKITYMNFSFIIKFEKYITYIFNILSAIITIK